MKFLYFYLISYSIIGYGFYLSKFLRINFSDFGSLGILGITFISVISFVSSIFLKHGYYFNSTVLLIGLIFFIINLKKTKRIKQEILNHFIIFFILCLFIILAKNHDDFPYYHFPYISIITEFSHPVGLGQLNNGFRSPSSIFFISSLFYLPFVDIYLFHITPALIMGFANLILLKKIFNQNIFDQEKMINFFSLSSLIFINIFFYRLAEHGTDRSGMILIILSIIYIISLMQNYQKIDITNEMKFLIICICFVSTIKPFFLLNFIFLILLLTNSILRKKFFSLFFSRTFYYCSLLILLIIFYTFINSACIIFPVTSTCFQDLSWSIDINRINDVKIWFELWSKGGANPNYVIEDSLNYIKNFNWFSNWLNEYFFNKVSDFLLGLLSLSLILSLSFYKKNITFLNKKNNLWSLFLAFLILFAEWFYNHPTLRYGGYHIIFAIFMLPICFYLSKIQLNFSFFAKRASILILITIVIFVYRNIQRLEGEYINYTYNPITNSDYKFTEKKEFYYRHNIQIKDNLEDYEKLNILGKKIPIILKK